MTTTGSLSPLLPSALSGGDTVSFLWRSGATLAFAGMLTGAFGAHGLKHRAGVTADDLHAWGTASTYAIANGLGLMIVSMHPRFSAHRFAGPGILDGWCAIFGKHHGARSETVRICQVLWPYNTTWGSYYDGWVSEDCF
ncbi:hypothetical protein J3R83DRAFT_6695 [Lanmaoa asiatica]|nr:hypothetical protein J3R83DRAFT_6695 [Lanmaoa asiatica]